MAKIKCPNCGKDVWDIAERCVNCGFVIKQGENTEKAGDKVEEGGGMGKIKNMSLCFGILDLFFGIMFFFMVLTSDGKFIGNMRITIACFLLILCGVMNFLSIKGKKYGICTVALYALSASYNYICSFWTMAHIFIFLFHIIFMIFVATSLKSYDKK